MANVTVWWVQEGSRSFKKVQEALRSFNEVQEGLRRIKQAGEDGSIKNGAFRFKNVQKCSKMVKNGQKGS